MFLSNILININYHFLIITTIKLDSPEAVQHDRDMHFWPGGRTHLEQRTMCVKMISYNTIHLIIQIYRQVMNRHRIICIYMFAYVNAYNSILVAFLHTLVLFH